MLTSPNQQTNVIEKLLKRIAGHVIIRANGTEKGYTAMPKRPYPRYQRRHHAILLSICRDPSKKQKDIAKETGYSESQVSRILCSPEFHEVYDMLIYEAAAEARSKWPNRTPRN
jgi:hypothetical protein